MPSAIWILICCQLLFTTSDLTARAHVRGVGGFSLDNFLSWWFLFYLVIRTLATFGQLYVLTRVELGRTMAMFGATSIILANVLGFILLNETLSTASYVGVSLAVLAFLVLAFG